jgi:GcrA cell cycle regulator
VSWTDETVATLRKLWDDGYSSSQIAARLPGSFTRNSVIGKVSRLGLSQRNPGPRKPIYRSRKSKPKPETKQKSAHSWGAGKTRPVWQGEALPLPAADDLGRVLFAETDETHCKWIVGDTQPRMCCGLSRVLGLPYCEGHAMRAYVAPNPRRTNDVRPMPSINPGDPIEAKLNTLEMLDV